MHRTRVWGKVTNILLVLCSLIAAIALMEFALRITDFSYLSTWRFDRVTGQALLEGSQMWHTQEGEAFVKINSDGLRDVEHSIEKHNDTIRIAILGDSYAEARQLPLDQTFWKVIEKELAHCSHLQDQRVEVINFGVSGFGTAQELLTLKTKVWKYSPDIVVLGFLTGNDIRNNSKALQQSNNRPYYVYREGNLVLDNSFLDKTKSRVLGSSFAEWWFANLPDSRVLQLLTKTYIHYDQQKKVGERELRKEVQEQYESGLDDEVYSPPSDPEWVNAWQVTEGLLRLINADVIRHNAQFLLVTLTNSGQVHPDINERNRYAASLNVDDLLYPDNRIQQLAREESIAFVKLVPPFQAWSEENEECLHGFDNADPCHGHWNRYGHQLAGTIIADNICQSLF